MILGSWTRQKGQALPSVGFKAGTLFKVKASAKMGLVKCLSEVLGLT